MDSDHRKIAAASVLTIAAGYIGYMMFFNTDAEGGGSMPEEDVTQEQMEEEMNMGGSTVPENDEVSALELQKMRLADSVKTGNLLSVKNLLWEIDVNSYLEGTKTPAYIASLYGRINVLRYLHSHNADLKHARDDTLGWSCAHAAASKGHVNCLEFMIQVGVDVTTPSQNGYTPLHCAREVGQLEVVTLLEKKRDEKLFEYARSGDVQGAQLCLDDGANVDICPFGSQTAAYIASYYGELEIIKLLHKNGANLMLADKDGFNCSHAAARRGHLEILRYLLETADINIALRTDSGKTTIDLAADNSHDHVVQYLLPHFPEAHGAGAEMEGISTEIQTADSNEKHLISPPVPEQIEENH